MKKYFILFLLFSLSFSIYSSPIFKEKKNIAIAPFKIETEGSDPSDYLTTLLSKTDLFKIVTIDEKKMKSFSDEFKNEELGFIDTEDKAKELGKFLRVDYILYGSLKKLGNQNIISIKIFDIETRGLFLAESVSFDNINRYKNSVERVALKIIKKIDPTGTLDLSIDKTSLSKYGLIVSKKVSNFISQLPKISGSISGMPRAGVLSIKLNKNLKFNDIPLGMKLVSITQGIDGKKKGGVLYIAKNKNGKYIGRYMRSEVGKFEIADKILSKLYKPNVAVGNINYSGTSLEFKKFINRGYKNFKFDDSKKVDIIIKKISNSNFKKSLRRLYGLGVDYYIIGDILSGDEGETLLLDIYSTYSATSIKKLSITIN